MSRGCLNYALVLRMDPGGEWQDLGHTNRKIMEFHRAAVEKLISAPVQVQGITDLTLDNLKFSGNAQRRRAAALLFHGTFLLDTDLDLISRYLAHPSSAPAYRVDRPHQDFLTRLQVSPDRLLQALCQCWSAHDPMPESRVPWVRVRQLLRDRYEVAGWHDHREIPA